MKVVAYRKTVEPWDFNRFSSLMLVDNVAVSEYTKSQAILQYYLHITNLLLLFLEFYSVLG